MKYTVMIALAIVFGEGLVASAQVNAYIEYGASKANTSTGAIFLYGPTGGASTNLVKIKRMRLLLDVRAASLDTGSGGFASSGQRLEDAGLGPMVSSKLYGFAPYAGVVAGFARYSNSAGIATTDSQLDYNAGVDRTLRGSLSWRMFEFGYKQYFSLGNQLSPQYYSTGLVYTFSRH